MIYVAAIKPNHAMASHWLARTLVDVHRHLHAREGAASDVATGASHPPPGAPTSSFKRSSSSTGKRSTTALSPHDSHSHLPPMDESMAIYESLIVNSKESPNILVEYMGQCSHYGTTIHKVESMLMH